MPDGDRIWKARRSIVVRTFTEKTADIDRKWFVVDAEGQTLGRLASRIAPILRGKHKPTYTPHLDCGDFVVVINAEKVRVTGRKLDQKFYYRHSGYPGGLKSTSLRDQLDRYPERVLQSAIKGMLPKNRLGRQMIRKLKVYAGASHPHSAQQPKPLDL
jgi:large subunit ribosomal protein L13